MNPTPINLAINPGVDATGAPSTPSSAGTGQRASSFGAVLQGLGSPVPVQAPAPGDDPLPQAVAEHLGEGAWTRVVAFAGERDPDTLPTAGPLVLDFVSPIPEALPPGLTMAPGLDDWATEMAPTPALALTEAVSLLETAISGEDSLAVLPEGDPQARLAPLLAQTKDDALTSALWPLSSPTTTEAVTAKSPTGILTEALSQPAPDLAAAVRQSATVPTTPLVARIKASGEGTAEPALETLPRVAPVLPETLLPVADPLPESVAAPGPVPWLNRYLAPQPTRPVAGVSALQAVAKPDATGGQAGETSAGDSSQGEGIQDLLAVADKLLAVESRVSSRAEPAAAFSRESAAPLVHQSASLAPRVDGQSIPGQPVLGQSPLQTPLNLAQPGWGQALGQQVLWLVQNGPQQAELKVTPPHLGPLEVSLSLDKQHHASITFFAPDAGVREALETALPRLRELFDGQGLNLQQANVSDQSLAGRQQGQANAGQDGARAFGNTGAVLADEGETPAEPARRVAVGLVDQYV